ncbi:MAG: hypothetical protein IT175_03145 [Acidobacteria bacterium]|nr:hypothetical protein [Acidobacteriota bacterium]
MRLGLIGKEWRSFLVYPVALLTVCSVLSVPSYAGPISTLPIATAPAALQEEPELPARDWQAEASNHIVDAQVLAGTYYDLTTSATCVVTFNNKGPAALDVTPTLYNLAGQIRTLAAVSVPANKASYVDMRTWVPVGDTQFEQGSIHLAYQGEDLRLGAQVRISRQADSTGFDEQLVDHTAKFAGTTLEGAWWLPTTTATMQLLLSNTSGSSKTATVTVARKGAASVTLPFTLTAHQTRVLDVKLDVLAGAALTQLGGIKVVHTGQPGNVLVRGTVTKGAIGYSASIDFIDPTMTSSSTLHGAGLRVKSIGGQELHSYVVARNLGAAATTVTGRLRYTTTSGSNNVIEMSPLTITGSDVQLIQPLNTLTPAQKELVAVAGVELEYSTLPGSVYLSCQSVSANGTHLFRVPMLDPLAQKSSSGGYPWQVIDDWSTVVYIKNVTAVPQYYTLQFNYAGGVYAPGQRELAAGQTVSIDIKELRNSQTPDEAGYKIPLTADKGQVQWSMDGDDNLVIIGRAEQVNPTIGLSSTYACQNCCPDSFYSLEGVPDPLEGPPEASVQLKATIAVSNCYGTIRVRVNDSFNRWLALPNPYWASNESIASVSPTSGLVTLNDYGNATIYTVARDREYLPGSGPGGCQLIISEFTEDTPVKVHSVSVTVSTSTVRPTAEGEVNNTVVVTVQATPAVPGESVKMKSRLALLPLGHNHGGTPATGTFANTTGITNASGQFQTTFTAPVFALLVLSLEGSIGKVSGGSIVSVGNFALVELPYNEPWYRKVGDDEWHPENHWGSPTCVAGLQELARYYNEFWYGFGYPPPNPEYHNVLSFNDISLVGGGKFDTANRAFVDGGDHIEHRLGRECDVRNINIDADRHTTVIALFEFAGIVSYINHTGAKPHWHVRFPQ